MGKLIGLLLGLAFFVVIGAALWEYTLNTWLIFFDKPTRIVFWQAMILAVIPGFGQLCVPAAIITWILMLFL